MEAVKIAIVFISTFLFMEFMAWFSHKYIDFIIVGGGLSGLHLSYFFSKDEYFHNHSILILDKGESKKKDNYFSFWECGNGNWDSILKNKWKR